jgi:putative intracellular protease/amidase
MNILMPLPKKDFDPTEAAVTWKMLSKKGVKITFATSNGEKAEADSIILTGKGLGIWKGILMAGQDAVAAYAEMTGQENYQKPLTYNDLKETDYDAIILPGGHDKGMREYLESKLLQDLIVDFFRQNKPVAAICHGVLLVARSIDSATGKSVLYEKKTTCLLKSQELAAYNMTRWWLGDYYRTYPETTTEDEVKSFLKDKKQFQKGSFPFNKDTENNTAKSFTVLDGNYLSARYPGDVYKFAEDFYNLLTK